MKTIKAKDIPTGAREFLKSLDLSRDEVLLEENGKPWLVLSPAAELERRQRAKEELFAIIDRIHQRNPGGDSDELLEELEAMDHPERAQP